MSNYFVQFLFWLYLTLGNLGWAITLLTIVIKLLLLPMSLSSLRAAEKIKKIQPHLEKLKKKHAKNPKKLQQEQLKLYQKHKINPLASFLPQIVQIVVFILLYRWLMDFLAAEKINGIIVNTHFFWLNLAKPDQYFILPILTMATQFILSKMMMSPNDQTNNSNHSKSKDKPNPMMIMQKQMIYVLPVITGLFALKFASGLVLYWVLSNIFAIFQQAYLMMETNKNKKE